MPSTNSGTSAIEIPLKALGVAGKEVLVQANTFFATAAAAIAAGAHHAVRRLRPRHDGHGPRRSRSRHRARHRRRRSSSTSAAWSAPRSVTSSKICDDHGLFLFEDAAHAHGSSLDGPMAGSFGFAGSFSFYPTKVMAGGEGGMIVTNDERIVDEARIYRDQGKASFLTNATPGSGTTGG